jgi:predicted nucleic acid-binding protein
MYVFDTNVLSEAMRDSPDPAVAAWLRACPIEAMFTTAISEMEILHGVRRLPDGPKRMRLMTAARALLEITFAGRILPFDSAAAAACADIRVGRLAVGSPITSEDGMIAAIARAHGATLVTRDRGLAGCGVPVVDPWRQQD